MFYYRLASPKLLITIVSLILPLSGIAPLPYCLAQGGGVTGKLVGHVYDKNGKSLPDVTVTVFNEKFKNEREVITDDKGAFEFPTLMQGSYTITASLDGYISKRLNGFPVSFNQINTVKYPPEITLSKGNSNKSAAYHGPSNNRGTTGSESDGNARNVITNESGSDNISEAALGNDVITDSPIGSGHRSVTELSIFLDRRDDDTSPAEPANTVNPDSAVTQQPSTGQTPPDVQEVDAGKAIAVVHTVAADRTSNVTERQIGSLPLGGATYMRTFDEFALLVAGVAPPPYTPGVRGPGVGFGIGTAGQFTVNGMRARSNNFSVDGSDNNDPDVGVRRSGFVALVPQSLESVQGFSISTLLWDAELGRNFGSQVNVVSKYGANEYHGQAYAFFNDSRLNARNFFDYQGGVSGGKDPLTRARAGFVIGGPIVRDRTQFFGSFEREKINASTEQHFSSPTRDERAFLPDRSNVNIENLFEAQLPTSLIHGRNGVTQLGSDIFSYFPLPNNPGGPYGSNTYTEILPADGEGLVSSFKLTQQVTKKHALNARYNFTDDHRVLPSINRAVHSTIGSKTQSQNLSLILDSQLTSTLFNLARFSFGRTGLDFPEHPLGQLILPSKSTPTQEITVDGNGNIMVSPNDTKTSIQQIGELIIEPFSPVGVNALFFPQGRVNKTFQYADSISWHWQDHSFKFGGDIRRVQFNSFQDRLYRPQVDFGYGFGQFGDLKVTPIGGKTVPEFTSKGNRFILSGVQLAALPLPSSTIQTLTANKPDSHIGLRITEFNFFFNDNWRVRPNFILDYGLRYEYNTPPHEVNNRIEDAITLRNLPAAGTNSVQTVIYKTFIDAYKNFLGNRTRIYDPDRNNFGPHLGFAWDPWSNGKSSIRAGYGIYYDVILGAVVSQSRNIFPNEIPSGINPTTIDGSSLSIPAKCGIVVCGDDFIPTNQLRGGPDAFVKNIVSLYFGKAPYRTAFTLPAKDLRTPYAQQWHLTLERELFANFLISAAYIGTRGIKLVRLTTPNGGQVTTPFIRIAKRDPALKPSTYAGYTIVNSTFPLEGFPQGTPVRPNPALGAYQIFDNSASSNYHALQLEASKLYGAGYTLTVAYTFSHAIDDVSDLFPIAGAPVLAQNQNNVKSDRGDANFDVRHRFAASLVWDLPLCRGGNCRAARLLGGWQLASIFQAHTGQPFTLNILIDANLDGNLTDRPSTTQGLTFIHGHDPRRILPGRTLEDFFVLGKDGAVGRNTVRGDSFINVDLSLDKKFFFAKEQTLTFRAEFFNLLNRANFGLPIRILGAPAFGSAVDTVNPGRTIQFALKYSF